jgi:hypothetical protein
MEETTMPLMPHDTADLALAPVVLQLEAEIQKYSGLTQDEVVLRVATETDTQPRSAHARRAAVVDALTHFVDLHGWETRITSRGLRLSHGDNTVTLGLPRSIHTYLDI